MAESINRDIATSISAAVKADNITSAGAVVAMTVVDSAGALPLSGHSAGDRAFVTGSNNYYIHNGSGWFQIALINTNPTFTSIVSGSDSVTTSAFALSSDGSNTVITLTATDPEGISVVYNATSNADFDGLASFSRSGNVVTITPKSEGSATTTSGTLTFTASDGINIGSAVRTFTLSFSTVVDQTSTYTTPLSNATNANYPSSSYSATSSYSSSDYSWTLGTISQNFGGFRKVIDWDVDNKSEVLFAVAVTGASATFNSRGGHEIGFQSSDFSKNVGFYRSSYNPSSNTYLYTRQDVASGLTIGGTSGTSFLAISETSSTISSWYMAMRINLSTGVAKGWISEDSGSTWTQSASGTYANPGDLTHAYIAMNRRTGTGTKIALLDAGNYSSTLTL